LLFLGRAAWPAHPADVARQATRIGQRLPEQVFDLCVRAAQVVRRPASQRVVHHGIQAEQNLLPFGGHGTSGSLIERAGVDNRLGVAVTTQHHQQVADHDRLALLVEVHYLVL
jgi:hypothetical protein